MTEPEVERHELVIDSAKDPSKYEFSPSNLKKERKWERDNIVDPNAVEYSEGLRYKYTCLYDAPGPHLAILELAARGRSVEVIANLSGRTRQSVVKVLEHAPNAQWLERVREKVRLIREQANEAKAELAVKAFDYEADVVKGDAEPNFVRLKAAQHAMTLDPHRRYEPQLDTEKHEVLDSDSVVEFIEKGASRFGNAIEVAATATEEA